VPVARAQRVERLCFARAFDAIGDVFAERRAVLEAVT
jgi:hypothetical protein